MSEEIVSGGRVPVYSANVYEEFGRIDKENMKDYSRPSVIWGIDGDSDGEYHSGRCAFLSYGSIAAC